MFNKLKKLFGVGKVEALKAAMLEEQEKTATIIREIVSGHETQDVLFEPQNAHMLRAYVLYGHSFSPTMFPTFLKTADRELVKIYLSLGFELSDKEKKAVLDLQDGELSHLLMESGSWCPFPYSGAVHPSSISQHCLSENELRQHCLSEDELGD